MALGLALYSFSPTIYASVTSGLPRQLKPIGLGAVTMAGNIFGAFSTSFIGYLIDTLGYQPALTAFSSVILAATALIFAVMQERPLAPGKQLGGGERINGSESPAQGSVRRWLYPLAVVMPGFFPASA